ncbi:caspase family protein [Massilia sp. B-10]|nr:caspase family protein [Massilia sp. B-10]
MLKHPAGPGSQASGKFDFSAYAFNADRVKSGTAHRAYEVAAAVTRPARRAYLVVIGVNAYENALLDLKYAANDAASIEQTLAARLRTRRLRGRGHGAAGVAPDDSARRRAWRGQQAKYPHRARRAGRAPRQRRCCAQIPNADKLRKATPDDAVFLSFSGHGFYESGGDFYLLPTDIGPGKTRQPTDAVLAASISSAELTRWLRPVDGGDMALVIDACHSGAAVGADFKPGPMGSRGLGQLAFDKGMLVLAATQADNVAGSRGT